MHIHLDKTFYGGKWEAPRPRKGKTIMDMIAREQVLIPKLLPTSVEHAEAIIGLLHSKGTTVARSHCNIDPVSGLKSLEHLKIALEKHQQDFSCEIVAFPQHGLLHSKVDGLMREAMQMGVQYVAGGSNQRRRRDGKVAGRNVRLHWIPKRRGYLCMKLRPRDRAVNT